MSLFDRIREFFAPGSSLRNKPGGLAYVNGNMHLGGGAGALVNRFVTTRRIESGTDLWWIDPELEFTATAHLRLADGARAWPGDVVVIRLIRDHALTPVPDAKLSKREVARLYEPGPAKVAAKERV